MKTLFSFNDLKDEIDQIRKENFKLKDDAAFVYWFLKAFLLEADEVAIKSLTGITGDKNLDAIYFDYKQNTVHVVQGKFRYSFGKVGEKRNDVLTFSDIASLPWEGKEIIETFMSKLDDLTQHKMREIINKVTKNGMVMRLYYVTTGKISETIVNEANARVRKSQSEATITILDYKKVSLLFQDYVSGIAPAVPVLELKIASERQRSGDGIIHRHDLESHVDSWVFSMITKDVGELYDTAGTKLFARNIRGFLGATEINEAMGSTLKDEPNNFWYFNNGVTIVCDDAKRETRGAKDVLVVDRPQIINGQQTTRMLSKFKSNSASILIKVIKVPRDVYGEDEYDDLVSNIVRSTNWQNYIKPSDLVANDAVQIYLEKEFRKKGYLYARKRQTKAESKRIFGTHHTEHIKKEDLAQVMAACEFDPSVVRKGREGLFEEPYYRKIFSMTYKINMYLTKYWLAHEVESAASGYPERAYAKWLIINFLWNKLDKFLSTDAAQKRFIFSEEQQKKPSWELYYTTGFIFKAAILFFRRERRKIKKGNKGMIDASGFFRIVKLHNKFNKFWKSSKNKFKNKAENKIKSFLHALKKISVD